MAFTVQNPPAKFENTVIVNNVSFVELSITRYADTENRCPKKRKYSTKNNIIRR